MRKGTGKADGWTFFDSVSDFVADIDRKHITREDNRSFCGGMDFGEALNAARNGDVSGVEHAQAMMDQINADVDTEGLRDCWQHSVVGPFPNVPAFLAGDPECMFSRRRVSGGRVLGPVNIYYSPVCSAGIAAADAYKRGVAVLAAVMLLSRIRPVSLSFVTCYGDGSDHVIPIRTDPMVLSEAAFAISGVAFYRALSYGWSRARGWDGKWAPWYKENSTDYVIAKYKDILSLGDEDIVIPPVHFSDEISADPAKWLNGILDKYRE